MFLRQKWVGGMHCLAEDPYVAFSRCVSFSCNYSRETVEASANIENNGVILQTEASVVVIFMIIKTFILY